MSNDIWADAPMISSYTRAQAIEDGTLVDLTEWASSGPAGMMGGFTIPVAVTAAVWGLIERIPKSLEGIADVRGRAHDVLWMASLAARSAGGRNPIGFRVILPAKGDRKRSRVFKMHIGGGDNGEPVITISLPEED